jgi:hypothetical protein
LRFCGFAEEKESQFHAAVPLPCQCSWRIESGSSFVLNSDGNRSFPVGADSECLYPADLRTINQEVPTCPPHSYTHAASTGGIYMLHAPTQALAASTRRHSCAPPRSLR